MIKLLLEVRGACFGYFRISMLNSSYSPAPSWYKLPPGTGSGLKRIRPLIFHLSWAYPKSKIETEKVIHAERGNIPVVILRIAGVYDDLCHSIPLALQIQRIYERDPVAYFSPGDPSTGRQPYVHNDDAVDAILLAFAHRKELPPKSYCSSARPSRSAMMNSSAPLDN